MISPRPPRRIALEGHPRGDTEVRKTKHARFWASGELCRERVVCGDEYYRPINIPNRNPGVRRDQYVNVHEVMTYGVPAMLGMITLSVHWTCCRPQSFPML